VEADLPESWVQLDDAPVALTEVAAAAFGGHIWVVGGFDAGGQAVPTVYVYDPNFDEWSPGPALPEGVHHTALVSTGDSLLVIGGYRGAGFGAPTADVLRLDPAVGEWEPGPALPEARAAGAAAWDGNRVVYGGGVGPGGVSSDVLALDGDQWVPGGGLRAPRGGPPAAGAGGGRGGGRGGGGWAGARGGRGAAAPGGRDLAVETPAGARSTGVSAVSQMSG
jgi:N-acetylneuraminic acid mutarotase